MISGYTTVLKNRNTLNSELAAVCLFSFETRNMVGYNHELLGRARMFWAETSLIAKVFSTRNLTKLGWLEEKAPERKREVAEATQHNRQMIHKHKGGLKTVSQRHGLQVKFNWTFYFHFR